MAAIAMAVYGRTTKTEETMPGTHLRRRSETRQWPTALSSRANVPALERTAVAPLSARYVAVLFTAAPAVNSTSAPRTTGRIATFSSVLLRVVDRENHREKQIEGAEAHASPKA